jgi:hypothetical protein
LEETVGYSYKAFHDYARRIAPDRNTEPIEEQAVAASPADQRPYSLPDRLGDLCFFLSSLLYDLFAATRDKFLLKESEIYSELAINNSQLPDSVEIFSQQRFHALDLLYQVTSSQVFLEKAKLLARSRLAYFETKPNQRKWLVYLAGVLSEEHKHSVKLEPLDEGIGLYRDALTIDAPEGAEGVEETAALHHGLAEALLARNEASLGKIDGSLEDIDEALANINSEMNILSSDPLAEELAYTIYGLRGQVYLSRFQLSGSQHDLDSAASDLRECKTRMESDSIYQSEASYSLACALLLSNHTDDNHQGEALLLEIWQGTRVNGGLRLLAAIQLSRYYTCEKNWQQASEMMDNAMDLLPVIRNPLQLLSDLANSARRFSNFVSEAFALTLQAGRGSMRAIDRLELSRASILNHVLNQKDEIRELKESPYREDAKRYLELRDSLGKQPDRLPLHGMQADAEVAAIKEFDDSNVGMRVLLQKIRSRPGFERFLLGPSQQQLCDAVSTGYVIVVNMTKLRSDAVIIGATGLRSIELRSLQFDDAAEWLKKNPTEY